MVVPHNPRQNHLLAALPAAEFNRLSANLELVPMPLGESFYESGGKLQYVYFPTTSIVSLHYVMEGGTHAEIAGVGNEGMLGISVFMGEQALPKRAFVRTVGYGYRLKARLLLDEFNRGETLQCLLLNYTKTLITEASQTAVCNRYHSVEQKLCRWLLLTFDRLPSQDLVVTQDVLASMLGVKRELISVALRKLQQAGLISCRRGLIAVLKRQELEDNACECYSVIKVEINRLLGGAAPEGNQTRTTTCTNICAPT